MPNLFNRNDGTFAQIDIASLGTTNIPLNSVTKATTADITLATTGVFVDGPAVTQGSSGTWFASGAVTCLSTLGGHTFAAKLWDGTTVIASGTANAPAAFGAVCISLSGVLASPAGNLRISASDFSAAGKIAFNNSGLSLDSFITAVRIG